MKSVRNIQERAPRLLAMALLLVTFFLIARNTAWSQQGEGALTGTVHDPSGASVSGANIELAEINTGRLTTRPFPVRRDFTASRSFRRVHIA